MRVYHGLAVIWGVWALIAAYSRGLVEGVAMAGMDPGWSWWWMMTCQTAVAAGVSSLLLSPVSQEIEGERT